MQVFGLPAQIIRNGRDAVARWLMARASGLTSEQAAAAVGVPRSTLERWRKRAEPLSRRPRRVRGPSRPAGLAAGQQLARAGHMVTVFERAEKPGGLLRYGIPEFKMEKAVLDRRLAQMEAEGTAFVCGVSVGAESGAGRVAGGNAPTGQKAVRLRNTRGEVRLRPGSGNKRRISGLAHGGRRTPPRRTPPENNQAQQLQPVRQRSREHSEALPREQGLVCAGQGRSLFENACAEPKGHKHSPFGSRLPSMPSSGQVED